MSQSDILRYQISFTTWATGRMLQSVAALSSDEQQHDFGTADKSIRGTLLHIFRSERSWLARLEGRVVQWSGEGESDAAFLPENWPPLRQAWGDWAASLTDADSARLITYQDLKGNPWTNAVTEIVLHVANHSAHHRGQVAGFIRSLGKTPPNVDSINYARHK